MTEIITYAEMLETAIEIGPVEVVYKIYDDILNGADSSWIYQNKKVTEEKFFRVTELVKLNPLGLKMIKVYSKKIGNGYHLCLSVSQDEANAIISKETNTLVTGAREVTGGLLQSLYFPDLQEDLFLFEYADRCIEYPAYVGFMKQ